MRWLTSASSRRLAALGAADARAVRQVEIDTMNVRRSLPLLALSVAVWLVGCNKVEEMPAAPTVLLATGAGENLKADPKDGVAGGPGAFAATWYISPAGNDSNPGTLAAPWATLQKAANTASAGDTVLARGGNYAATPGVILSQPGITFKAYPGERPVFTYNCGKAAGGYGFSIQASNITLDGLTLLAVGAGDSQGIIGFGWDRLAARSCPDCGEAMKEMSVKQMPDIPIDRCAKCNQVWFDDGELSMVAAEAQKAQQKRMLDA